MALEPDDGFQPRLPPLRAVAPFPSPSVLLVNGVP